MTEYGRSTILSTRDRGKQDGQDACLIHHPLFSIALSITVASIPSATLLAAPWECGSHAIPLSGCAPALEIGMVSPTLHAASHHSPLSILFLFSLPLFTTPCSPLPDHLSSLSLSLSSSVSPLSSIYIVLCSYLSPSTVMQVQLPLSILLLLTAVVGWVQHSVAQSAPSLSRAQGLDHHSTSLYASTRAAEDASGGPSTAADVAMRTMGLCLNMQTMPVETLDRGSYISAICLWEFIHQLMIDLYHVLMEVDPTSVGQRAQAWLSTLPQGALSAAVWHLCILCVCGSFCYLLLTTAMHVRALLHAANSPMNRNPYNAFVISANGRAKPHDGRPRVRSRAKHSNQARTTVNAAGESIIAAQIGQVRSTSASATS